MTSLLEIVKTSSIAGVVRFCANAEEHNTQKKMKTGALLRIIRQVFTKKIAVLEISTANKKTCIETTDLFFDHFLYGCTNTAIGHLYMKQGS